jgi:hypothetical protein
MFLKAEFPHLCERAIRGCTYVFHVLPEQGLLFFFWFFSFESVKMEEKRTGCRSDSLDFFPSVLGFLLTSVTLSVNCHWEVENHLSSYGHVALLPSKLFTELFCRKPKNAAVVILNHSICELFMC